MNEYDANLCVNNFSKLCDKAEHNELVNSADFQYWVFEQGYLAAMEEITKVVNLRQTTRLSDLSAPLIAKRQTCQ